MKQNHKDQLESVSWSLINIEQRHSENPVEFQILSRKLREAVKPDDLVKLIFSPTGRGPAGSNPENERMWVLVKETAGTQFRGILDNDPQNIDNLTAGDEVSFGPEHILEIYED